MSTRACIAIKLSTENYKHVYCHFCPEHADLIKYFPTENNANALINLGDLSYVEKDQVFAYHRDRGESKSKTAPRYSKDFNALKRDARNMDGEHLFYFEDNEWQHEKLYN